MNIIIINSKQNLNPTTVMGQQDKYHTKTGLLLRQWGHKTIELGSKQPQQIDANLKRVAHRRWSLYGVQTTPPPPPRNTPSTQSPP